MAVPTITDTSHDRGPVAGGDVVRLIGTGFEPEVQVLFGQTAGEVLRVIESAGQTYADVRSPPMNAGAVDVTLQNLDAAGAPIAGELVTLQGAYTFLRPALATEADLTRVVRQLLQELGRQVLDNVSISVSADYGDDDGTVAIASLPALVLSGPKMTESRLYSTNELSEQLVVGADGPEVVLRRPPFTVELEFRLTGASENTVELLNLMSAASSFLHRTRWLYVDRDASDPGAGRARYELSPVGEFRTRMSGDDGVRVFTGSFVVRGFDIEDARTLDVTRPVEQHEETFVELEIP